MQNFKKLLKSNKRHELVLGVILLIYIIFQIDTPQALALHINSVYGTIFVVVVALSLFATVNPIVAIVGILAAIELLRRSKMRIVNGELTKQLPTEDRKTFDVMSQNQFPMTLEEEIVKNRAPLVSKMSVSAAASYKPVLEDDNNATLISSM
tara:strand:- start:209 stop:664 length:456 start_codon:yes stop_codon:yes gene_type:complete